MSPYSRVKRVHKPEKSQCKWDMKGCRNQLTFQNVEFMCMGVQSIFIWHAWCILGGILKKDAVRFYGIISYFQMISWLEHWLNNARLVIRLRQKSGCAATVTLPTASVSPPKMQSADDISGCLSGVSVLPLFKQSDR